MLLGDILSRLTLVDCILFVAVLRGLYVGYKSGFIIEFFRVLTYAATAAVTLRFSEPLAQWLTLNTFLNETSSKVLGMGLLIAVTFGGLKLLSLMAIRLFKIGEGAMFSRLLGSLLGAVRWVFIISLFFMAVDGSPFQPLKADIHDRSLTGPQVVKVAPLTLEFLETFDIPSPAKTAPAAK